MSQVFNSDQASDTPRVTENRRDQGLSLSASKPGTDGNPYDPANGQLTNPEAKQADTELMESIELGRTQSSGDLDLLLTVLPPSLTQLLHAHEKLDQLVEVVMDLGRRPEARFFESSEYLGDEAIAQADLDYTVERVGHFGGDNRAGIEKTLHRISAMRNRQGKVVGLTCRVGRAVFGTIAMIRDLVETGGSILMLGRPGVGKTTALREIARVLADDLDKRVVIIDTSNEIAGDGDIPHPAIGRARRMQVARPELQHQIMIEAVENHMPEVIVIDEIGTELEALAARTIAERGVQLVGTAHGNQLANLIKNPTLSDLVGGIQSVTLGDEEARRRGSQKTVLERKAPPTFEIAVEMQERQRWVVYPEVAHTIDRLLRKKSADYQVRTVDDSGEVSVTHEQPEEQLPLDSPKRGRNGVIYAPMGGADGWRGSGRMQAVPPRAPRLTGAVRPLTPSQEFQQLLDANPAEPDKGLDDRGRVSGYTYVYPYAISRHQLDQVIELMNLPVVLTKELDSADAVMALRSHLKNHSKLRTLAKNRQLPIYIVKSNNMSQISRTLRRLLKMDDDAGAEPVDLRLFSRQGNDDELEALEEARLAVEQIVLPKGQPVELLPRSPKVRKMQHELVEHYKLSSTSFGDEPNRRLRIFPA